MMNLTEKTRLDKNLEHNFIFATQTANSFNSKKFGDQETRKYNKVMLDRKKTVKAYYQRKGNIAKAMEVLNWSNDEINQEYFYLMGLTVEPTMVATDERTWNVTGFCEHCSAENHNVVKTFGKEPLPEFMLCGKCSHAYANWDAKEVK